LVKVSQVSREDHFFLLSPIFDPDLNDGRSHLKATVPEWREKKVLFGDMEDVVSGEEVKEELPPEEPSSVLFNHLDRTYKRLRRELKRGKKRGEGFKEQWLRELEQVEKKLGEIEKEL
jgi:hypothetical protein